MIKKAFKDLPSFISFDPIIHTNINDLCFLVRHELDLIKEEPEHFEHLNRIELKRRKNECESFLKNYKKYV